MGCLGFTWGNQKGNLVSHAGAVHNVICLGISGEPGIFSFAFPVFARLRPSERVGASNLSCKTLSRQYTLLLRHMVWRAMKTSSKSGWHHHKYRICVVKFYLLFVTGRGFYFVKFITMKSWRCTGEMSRSLTLQTDTATSPTQGTEV